MTQPKLKFKDNITGIKYDTVYGDIEVIKDTIITDEFIKTHSKLNVDECIFNENDLDKLHELFGIMDDDETQLNEFWGDIVEIVTEETPSEVYKVFAFIGIEQMNGYESLGFTLYIDDEINEVYVAEKIVNNHDELKQLHEECKQKNMDFHIEHNGESYVSYDELPQL
jgi:hypothetical protein